MLEYWVAAEVGLLLEAPGLARLVVVVESRWLAVVAVREEVVVVAVTVLVQAPGSAALVAVDLAELDLAQAGLAFVLVA